MLDHPIIQRSEPDLVSHVFLLLFLLFLFFIFPTWPSSLAPFFFRIPKNSRHFWESQIVSGVFQPMRGMWSDDESREISEQDNTVGWGGMWSTPSKISCLCCYLVLVSRTYFQVSRWVYWKSFPGYLNKNLAKADTQYVAISPIAELGQ